MRYLVSILAFVFFPAGSVVMIPAVGPDGSIGLLSTNLPTTVLWTLGFLVLVGAVYFTRNKAH
ncbi:hypothetical protein [Luteolibacter arcticus]|uniref:hypothetical protein n=1 Tax=Luteolibacter arcticus TaxID=1581411 RepID=UPI002222B29A|nr:hypothetical protein [Luteolibacter arcticus]